MTSLADLKLGQTATVKKITHGALYSRLIEMGCFPGESIQLSKTAPMGCPLAITIAGYELSLRRDEAAFVLIEVTAS